MAASMLYTVSRTTFHLILIVINTNMVRKSMLKIVWLEILCL